MKASIYKEKKLMFAMVFTCLLQVMAMILTEEKKGLLIDSIFELDIDQIYIKFQQLIILIAAMIAFGYFYSLSRVRFTQNVTYDLREKFLNSFFNKDIQFQFNINKSELLTRYNMEIGTIEKQFLTMLTLFIEMAMQIILIIFAMIKINANLALASIIVLFAPVLVPKIFEKRLETVSAKKKLVVENHISKFISWLNSFELIKSFEIESKLQDLFEESNKKYMKIDMDFLDESAKNIGISFLTSLGSQALIIIASGIFLINNKIGVGEFVTITGLVGNLRVPTYWISTYYQMIISTRPIRKSLDSFINEIEDKQIKTEVIKNTDDISIFYKDLSYSYNRKEPILKNINLKINGNKKVLITGKSGSGKTTLINLLLGYYEPDLGEVRINGIIVKDIANLEDYITVSRQEATLFNDTLRNNVSMFNSTINDSEIEDVLKKVGLFKGENYFDLEEYIQEEGINFSGGEKKRISLARALLNKSKILILDEPLANIDNENLEKIEDLILGIEDKLTIVISHQFNEKKLKKFDLILNCREGKIYEEIYI